MARKLEKQGVFDGTVIRWLPRLTGARAFGYIYFQVKIKSLFYLIGKMFDQIFNTIKTNRHKDSANDFADYHSNTWNKQASNVAQSLVRSLRGLRIGRFRYDSVNDDDPSTCYNSSNWIQMLPRVYDATPNGRGGCWSPVELSASRNGIVEREISVVDRFMGIVQIDRSLPIVIDEKRMERFYVNRQNYQLNFRNIILIMK